MAAWGKFFPATKATRPTEMDEIEVPASWFIAGQLSALVGLAVLAKLSFDMPLWQSILAVLLTFFLALVACRVTGETDTTPIGAMGKVTQLFFGALSPGNMNVNLMSANITAGAAGLGRRPLDRSQKRLSARRESAQAILGAVRRHIFGHDRYGPLLSHHGADPAVLGDKFPAPSAMAWMAVAEASATALVRWAR